MSAMASTLLWAAYVAAVGLLAALAAYVVEPVARALRWPTRWLWALALVAQLGAIVVALGAPDAASPARWFLWPWIAAAALAVLAYVRALRALGRERGSWRVTIAEEMPVWVSRETGPAVVGFLRSIVVAPAWAMALAERERRMLLRHEAEHVAAWDPTLLLLGLATCALVPWSPAAWWALARLRLAIEVDCDRRVLSAEPDVAAYGELLVAVQGRVVPGAAGLAAFAERRLPLEERIEAMTARRPRGAAWRWSARGAVAGSLVLAACMAPRPTTASLSGIVDIRADDLKVKRNADGTQTITATNATITARPDTTAPSGRVVPLLRDSSLYAQLESTVRSLDSVVGMVRSGQAAGPLDELLRQFGNVDQGRASKLATGAVQRYLVQPTTRPVAGDEVAFLLLDEGGDVVRDVRERRQRAARNGVLRTGDAEFARRFPDMAGRAVPTGGTVMIGDSVFAMWWLLESEQVLTERALTRAVERAFGPAGLPQHAVGLVAALDEKWNVLDARSVPLESLPPSPIVRASDRERLLPVLASHPAWTEGTVTSSGRFFGLAARSQVYFWRRTTPEPLRDVSRLNVPWIIDRAAAALDAHFASGGTRPTTAVNAWVLLDPRGAPLEVRFTPGTDALALNADIVRRQLTSVGRRQLESFGHRDGESFGLPSDSRVVWAMLMSADDLGVDDDSTRPTRKATRVITDSVRAYAGRHGLTTSGLPVTVRVLLNPSNDLLGIMHGPLVRRLPADSVLAAFPDGRGKAWLRAGVMPATVRHGLPDRSEIAWVQLSPPRVIRVEPADSARRSGPPRLIRVEPTKP
jgi:hypothetical protein